MTVQKFVTYNVLDIGGQVLNEEQKQINLVSSFNEKLKDSIWNISSSSALFKEIALIIPKDIQFAKSIYTKPKKEKKYLLFI